MVPSVARFSLVHHGIQYPLRRSVLLPAPDEDPHLLVVTMEKLRVSPRYPAIYHLEDRRVADIRSSMSTGRHQLALVLDAPVGILQRLALLRRLALWVITDGVRLPDPIVGRGDWPFGSLSHPRTWHVEYPPPNYSTSPLPLAFPPLTEFARGWLSFFERLEARVPVTQGIAPLSRAKESLDVESTLSPIINVAFPPP